MSLAPALTKLKSLEQGLRAQGMCALHVFGSQARGEGGKASDIDLMFEVSPEARFSLFDQARIAREIGEALGMEVDLVPRRALHPLVRASAEAERVTVFN